MDAAVAYAKFRETAGRFARRLRTSATPVLAYAEKLPATKAALVVECVLTVALAAVLAQVVWDIVEPMPPATAGEAAISAPRASPVLRFAALTSADPFHRDLGAPAARAFNAPRAPETMLSLELFGIRADGAQGGSVIIGTPDNKQDVYFIGDEILEGVRLERILQDHVEIRRNGVSEALSFARDQKVASTSAPNAASDAAGAGHIEANLRRFLSVVRFVPASGGKGLAISETSDRALLRQAGLEQGDVVLSINGLAATDIGALRNLAEAGARSLTLEIERRGNRKIHTFKVDQP